MGISVRKTARASWQGDVPRGNGRISVGSGALDAPYSLRARVNSEDDAAVTNPEELIGAAHAGCFAMSLANLLSDAGHTPNDVTARATVHLDQTASGFEISRIALDVRGDVPGIDEETFRARAQEAKDTCPVSRALAGTSITLNAELGVFAA